MAVTPFRAVNFQPNQLLSEELLDQLASNQTWLYEMTPRAVYTYGSLRRREGVKLISGRALIGATKRNHASTTVRFGDFFSANCNPNITNGIVSAHQRRFFVTLDGIGQLMPDNRGFQIHVYLDAQTATRHDKIARNIYISWQAMGY